MRKIYTNEFDLKLEYQTGGPTPVKVKEDFRYLPEVLCDEIFNKN